MDSCCFCTASCRSTKIDKICFTSEPQEGHVLPEAFVVRSGDDDDDDNDEDGAQAEGKCGGDVAIKEVRSCPPLSVSTVVHMSKTSLDSFSLNSFSDLVFKRVFLNSAIASVTPIFLHSAMSNVFDARSSSGL